MAYVHQVEFAGGRGHHDLVERGHALATSTEADERATTEILRHGQHASVGKALADCLDLAERTQRAAGIAGEELLQRFS